MRTLAVTVAAALTMIAGAQAAPPNLAALGYTVYADNDPMTGGGVCPKYRVTGYGADLTFRGYNGLSCDQAGMESQMHVFASGHDERKLGFEHPAAVSARSSVQGKGYTVATNYAGPLFTVTGGCNVNQKVGPAGLATLDASLATAAPCPAPAPAPAPTTTETTTTTSTTTTTAATPTTSEPTATVTPTVDPVVTELQAQVAALVQKVATLTAAVQAAWTALVDALADGKAPWAAALAARSAGLNELYGL